MHNVHMRVPYGTESLPKTSLADAALHGCSLTRRSNMAYVGVQRNSRLRAASICIHQLRPPIPRTRKQGRVFARRRRKNWNLGSETVEFSGSRWGVNSRSARRVSQPGHIRLLQPTGGNATRWNDDVGASLV